MRSFFYQLDAMSRDAKQDDNLDLLVLCGDVKSYIMEATFTKYKKAKTILGVWGMTYSEASFATGMKGSTIREARKKLSNELYELFGYDFFTVVGEGSKKAISEGRARLNLAKRGFRAEEFIPQEVLRGILSKAEVGGGEDIDVTSCGAEIQFLVRHSKQNIEYEMSKLDINKLVYLIKMLNNEADTLSNIRRLVGCFERTGK